jgi:hypothetical protein
MKKELKSITKKTLIKNISTYNITIKNKKYPITFYLSLSKTIMIDRLMDIKKPAKPLKKIINF